MAEYELYCFAQSGNAYKAALMLELCGCDWEPCWVDFFNGETRTPEYRALNEMGEVPVLIHGQRTLSQSGVILDYLSGTTDKYRWQDETERLEVLRWLLFDNHKLTGPIATLRYMRTIVKTGETPVTEFLHARATAALTILDGHLGGQSFVIGAWPTIADFSLCGYLFWPDEFGVSWDDYPHIAHWLGRIEALPGWKHPYDLMPGHPLPE